MCCSVGILQFSNVYWCYLIRIMGEIGRIDRSQTGTYFVSVWCKIYVGMFDILGKLLLVGI